MPIAALADYREWLIAGQRDLEIQDACDPTVLNGDWSTLVQQARSLLDGYQGRLGVHGPFMGLTIMARDPKLRTLVQERLRQGLEMASALGATHMVVHSPFDFFGSPFLPHSSGHGLADQLELVHSTLDPLVSMAQQANCTLVIETIYDLHTAPLLALIRSFQSNFVRLSIDTGHAFIKHQFGGPHPINGCARGANYWLICIFRTPMDRSTVTGRRAMAKFTGTPSLRRCAHFRTSHVCSWSCATRTRFMPARDG
jgi:sugar phosphate isomerase/epimerase